MTGTSLQKNLIQSGKRKPFDWNVIFGDLTEVRYTDIVKKMVQQYATGKRPAQGEFLALLHKIVVKDDKEISHTDPFNHEVDDIERITEGGHVKAWKGRKVGYVSIPEIFSKIEMESMYDVISPDSKELAIFTNLREVMMLRMDLSNVSGHKKRNPQEGELIVIKFDDPNGLGEPRFLRYPKNEPVKLLHVRREKHGKKVGSMASFLSGRGYDEPEALYTSADFEPLPDE